MKVICTVLLKLFKWKLLYFRINFVGNVRKDLNVNKLTQKYNLFISMTWKYNVFMSMTWKCSLAYHMVSLIRREIFLKTVRIFELIHSTYILHRPLYTFSYNNYNNLFEIAFSDTENTYTRELYKLITYLTPFYYTLQIISAH